MNKKKKKKESSSHISKARSASDSPSCGCEQLV